MKGFLGTLAVLVLAVISVCSAYAAGTDSAAREATRLVNAEKYAEAARKYEEALKSQPDNPSLHLSLGLVYQSLKRYRDAVHAIENASELAPKNPQAYYSLGLLYEALAIGGGEEAERTIDPRKRFLSQAGTAWEKFLRYSKNKKKIKVAKKHLRNIREELEQE